MKNYYNGKRSVLGLAIFLILLHPEAVKSQTVNATFKVVCIANPKAKEIIHRKACIHKTPQVSFGAAVTLAVEHVPEVTFDDEGEPNPTELVLFLEGKALPGTNATVGHSQTDEDDVTTTLLTYRIVHELSTETSRKNWKEVLEKANSRPELAVSTGLEDGPPSWTQAKVEFKAVRPERLLVWFLIALVGLVAFFVIAARTGALRDQEIAPKGTNVEKPKDRAFSLSRSQMALWTILILYSYIFIWLLTGEYKATIPASAVVLMGIALTTYATAAAVDATKQKDNQEKVEKAKKELAANPGDPTLIQEVTTFQKRTMVAKSEGFFRDITTSKDGASLHRLQFILWTLTLAVVFIVTAWRTLGMPDFDATLLGLMGITSGTYVGLKLPEEKKSEDD